MSWSARFFDPIPLPSGGELVTLRDAGEYIAALPRAEQRLEHWQTAAEALLLGHPMLARIAMMRALHWGQDPPERERRGAKRYKIFR